MTQPGRSTTSCCCRLFNSSLWAAWLTRARFFHSEYNIPLRGNNPWSTFTILCFSNTRQIISSTVEGLEECKFVSLWAHFARRTRHTLVGSKPSLRILALESALNFLTDDYMSDLFGSYSSYRMRRQSWQWKSNFDLLQGVYFDLDESGYYAGGMVRAGK